MYPVMSKRLISIASLLSMIWLTTAQSTLLQQDSVPVVSIIGEYEDAFSALAEECPGVLLSVCGNDMDIAYEKWTDMMVAMEDHADAIDYDIKGLKTYFYIFWNSDGTVAHLSFYPKANSRNIPEEELRAFFKSFAKEYQMPIVSEVGFSHYGSASFPTHARPEYRVRKD